MGSLSAWPGLRRKCVSTIRCRWVLPTQLDETAADGSFAGGPWKISARPSFRIVALEDRQAEHVRHAPLVGGGAGVVTKRRPRISRRRRTAPTGSPGAPGKPGPDLAARVAGLLDGPTDILVFVVEAGIDFIQAIALGPALAEIRPLLEFLPRRTAIAPARKVTESRSVMDCATSPSFNPRISPGSRFCCDCAGPFTSIAARMPVAIQVRTRQCIIFSWARTAVCPGPRTRRTPQRLTLRVPRPW